MKTTLAALCALGIAAQPQDAAAADGDDVARALAGLAVIAIVAKAVDDRNDKKKRKAAERRHAEETSGAALFGRRDDRRVIDWRIRPYGDNTRPVRRGHKKHALPRHCLRTVETRRGDRTAYASDCLNHSYRFASRLPRSCETAVRTPRGFRTVYGRRCLARDGWNVAVQ